MRKQTMLWRTPKEGLPPVAKNGLSEPVLYTYKDAEIFHATITEIGQYSDAPWCEKTFVTDLENDRMVGVDAVMEWAFLNEEHEAEYSTITPSTP